MRIFTFIVLSLYLVCCIAPWNPYNMECEWRVLSKKETGWIVWSDTLKSMHKLWIETYRNVTVAIEIVPSATIVVAQNLVPNQIHAALLSAFLLFLSLSSAAALTLSFTSTWPTEFEHSNYKHLYWCMHKCRRKFASLTANFPSAHICYYPEAEHA